MPIVSMLNDVADRIAATTAKSIRRSKAQTAPPAAFNLNLRPPALKITPLLGERSRDKRT